MKRLVIIIYLLVFWVSSYSQNAISISMNSEAPLGELAYVYNPTISGNFSYIFDFNKSVLDVSIGFYRFEPKEDIFYYLDDDDDDGFGTAVYSNYFILPVSASFLRKIPIGEKFNLYPGIGLGYYMTYYSCDSDNFGESTLEGKGAIIPKIGFSYKLSKRFELKFESKYNLFFSVGSSDVASYDYNSNIGTYNTSWSNGLSLIFYFKNKYYGL